MLKNLKNLVGSVLTSSTILFLSPSVAQADTEVPFWLGLGGGAASTGAGLLGATVTGGAGAAAIPWLYSIEASLLIHSGAAEILSGDDPFDPNYTEIYEPVIP